jgi:pterin-4a-carbinolamine dehydratase
MRIDIYSMNIIKIIMKYLKEFFSEERYLEEQFNFKDIYEATEFIKKSCDVFTELDHHPDYFGLDGKTVKIKITTHDKGEVTHLDFEVVSRLKDLVKECCKPFNPHF